MMGGSITGLDVLDKTEFYCSQQEHPAHSLVARPTAVFLLPVITFPEI